MAAAAEKLPYPTLNSIADHRITHLTADRDPQPTFRLLIGSADDDEICRVNSMTGS